MCKETWAGGKPYGGCAVWVMGWVRAEQQAWPQRKLTLGSPHSLDQPTHEWLNAPTALQPIARRGGRRVCTWAGKPPSTRCGSMGPPNAERHCVDLRGQARSLDSYTVLQFYWPPLIVPRPAGPSDARAPGEGIAAEPPCWRMVQGVQPAGDCTAQHSTHASQCAAPPCPSPVPEAELGRGRREERGLACKECGTAGAQRAARCSSDAGRASSRELAAVHH